MFVCCIKILPHNINKQSNNTIEQKKLHMVVCFVLHNQTQYISITFNRCRPESLSITNNARMGHTSFLSKGMHLTRVIPILTPLRALSCLLFNRADSESHYDSNGCALSRQKGDYSATTNVASLVTIRLSLSYKVSHALIPFLIHDPLSWQS